MIGINFTFVCVHDLITAIPIISFFKLLLIIGHQNIIYFLLTENYSPQNDNPSGKTVVLISLLTSLFTCMNKNE